MEFLNVYQPDHPTLTPVPSFEFIQASIERESLRRIFWLIHLSDIMRSVCYKQPMGNLGEQGMRLRLPVDETSFELGVHSTLPGKSRAVFAFLWFSFGTLRLPTILILFAFKRARIRCPIYTINRIPLPSGSQNPVFIRIRTPHPRRHDTCEIGVSGAPAGR